LLTHLLVNLGDRDVFILALCVHNLDHALDYAAHLVVDVLLSALLVSLVGGVGGMQAE
jgi:hypothetical protein